MADSEHNPTPFPTIYADAVGNLMRSPGVVKFYLVRFDAAPPDQP